MQSLLPTYGEMCDPNGGLTSHGQAQPHRIQSQDCGEKYPIVGGDHILWAYMGEIEGVIHIDWITGRSSTGKFSLSKCGGTIVMGQVLWLESEA